MRSPLALLAAAAVADAALVGRTNLTDPSARCMDGTLSAYYYQPATTARGTTHWVIYLQGGGECTTKSACDGALTGPLGSSNYFPSEVDMDGATYADDDPKANPGACVGRGGVRGARGQTEESKRGEGRRHTAPPLTPSAPTLTLPHPHLHQTPNPTRTQTGSTRPT
jgi:hypothetical protein